MSHNRTTIETAARRRPRWRPILLRRAVDRSGLSLLEVILAIAILGGSMVMIGNLYFVGYRSALIARLRSEANILADSKMAELAAGVLPLESAGRGPIPESPGWVYSVQLQDSFQAGLFLVTVAVEREDDVSSVPTGVSIVRFIPDPDYEPEEDEE